MAKKTIEIDADLYEKAEKVAKDNGYEALDEFVGSILNELIEENEGTPLTEKDKKEVHKRLKNLGYVD